MWQKRKLVLQAFEEIGLAGYVFDLKAEQLQSALRTMDAMAAKWDGEGIAIGYALPSSPESSDLDEDSGIPDTAAEAVYLGLAVRLGPRFGKTVSQDTRINAKLAYDALVNMLAGRPPQMQYPSTFVRGAGARRCSRPFMPPPDSDPLQVDEGGDLEILGD